MGVQGHEVSHVVDQVYKNLITDAYVKAQAGITSPASAKPMADFFKNYMDARRLPLKLEVMPTAGAGFHVIDPRGNIKASSATQAGAETLAKELEAKHQAGIKDLTDDEINQEAAAELTRHILNGKSFADFYSGRTFGDVSGESINNIIGNRPPTDVGPWKAPVTPAQYKAVKNALYEAAGRMRRGEGMPVDAAVPGISGQGGYTQGSDAASQTAGV